MKDKLLKYFEYNMGEQDCKSTSETTEEYIADIGYNYGKYRKFLIDLEGLENLDYGVLAWLHYDAIEELFEPEGFTGLKGDNIFVRAQDKIYLVIVIHDEKMFKTTSSKGIYLVNVEDGDDVKSFPFNPFETDYCDYYLQKEEGPVSVFNNPSYVIPGSSYMNGYVNILQNSEKMHEQIELNWQMNEDIRNHKEKYEQFLAESNNYHLENINPEMCNSLSNEKNISIKTLLSNRLVLDFCYSGQNLKQIVGMQLIKELNIKILISNDTKAIARFQALIEFALNKEKLSKENIDKIRSESMTYFFENNGCYCGEIGCYEHDLSESFNYANWERMLNSKLNPALEIELFEHSTEFENIYLKYSEFSIIVNSDNLLDLYGKFHDRRKAKLNLSEYNKSFWHKVGLISNVLSTVEHDDDDEEITPSTFMKLL